VDQLKDVKGIGDVTFDKIKADVSVSGATTPAPKSAAAAPAAPMKAEAPQDSCRTARRACDIGSAGESRSAEDNRRSACGTRDDP
jgi:hypothetical protein